MREYVRRVKATVEQSWLDDEEDGAEGSDDREPPPGPVGSAEAA